MNKKIITLILGICLIGIVFAGTTIIQNVVIPADVEENITTGLIRYKCDGIDMNFTISEVGEYKDDAYDGANQRCEGEVTFITDWNNRVLKGDAKFYSFDEKDFEDKEIEPPINETRNETGI